MTESNKKKHVGLSLAFTEYGKQHSVESRLKQWAKEHLDDPIANDIQSYIEKSNDDIRVIRDKLIKGFGDHIDTLRAFQKNHEDMKKYHFKVLSRLEKAGLLTRPCKKLTFKPCVSGWLVGDIKQKPILIQSSMKGLGYIHQILKAANSFIDCTVLEGMHLEGNYIPDDIPLVESADLKRIHSQIQLLEAQYEDAIAADNLKRAEKIDNDRDALINYLKPLEGLHGKPRISGVQEKSRQRVKQAIKDALVRLKKESPAIHAVIDEGLTTGSRCIFTGSNDWET